ncbi:hypothetical protein DCAR_0729420 [Daucus carota subsp. sativus]|uniref:non-specific serine/threonine protein kinase n=2 Tax=Daucus carota subsp. sativus TaxID=79200 RepID=A0A164U5V7_DAUCS|nr:hypothetical protein DCAR_0729420 [Daucus carota subsp. sativus]
MVTKRNLSLLLLQHLVLIIAVQVSGDHYHHIHHHSLENDRAALLAFKRTISYGPNSTLENWNETTRVCSFGGVYCNQKQQVVTKLILLGTELVGLLSPFISNLTGLRGLILTGNYLSGIIPLEFSSLYHLRLLRLDGNKLHGPIPDIFASFSSLLLISLAGNNLVGTIPASLFSNCNSLHNIDLSENSLTGLIPLFGNCSNLWNLNLYNNRFTGEIPLSLTKASFMYNLDLENNLLSGELPVQLIANLTKLKNLHLSYNNMVSHDHNTNLYPFFFALANCSVLKELELAGIGLGGILPGSVGQLSVKLKYMLLGENQIAGSIPLALGNLSALTTLNLSNNLLNGTLPAELSQLRSLEQLILSNNYLTGEIPATLGLYSKLGLLDLSWNKFFGAIPEGLGNLIQIRYMFLNNNLLSGEIPKALGRCTDLDKLDLSYNMLTGSIPPDVKGMREIRMYLNLSHNQLQGSLPLELSKLQNVQEIDLSSNNLTGSIFVQISNCIALRMLNFSNNFLVGQLPQSLGDLKNLEVFDVSTNGLSGNIPVSLSNIHNLIFLNLSTNDFSGTIPSGGIFETTTYLSFLGNQRLCGSVPGIAMCHQKRHYFRSPVFLSIFCIIISISAFFSTICFVIGYKCIRGASSAANFEAERMSEPGTVPSFPRITYKQLSEATGGFDEQRIIGSGSYGRVYKGVLSEGTPIAIKVLQFQTGNSTKSFTRECQVLKRIRHRNLIRIITTCSLPDFKALVLPYMENGSLDSYLYPQLGMNFRSDSSDLSLIQIVNICSDIAEGMAYLHHHSPVRVIHCDLKPSNVLLNDDLTALISDFGIARLVLAVGGGNAGVTENMGNSTANMLSGTIGYIAPEYAFGSNTSTQGDVYSFGILILEMVTRKRPTDVMFVGGLSLRKWVKSYYHQNTENVIYSSLLRALHDLSPEVKSMWEVVIRKLLELGILCTQYSALTRPTMLDVADDLDRLKRYLSGDTTATFASSLSISSSTTGDD